MKKRNQDQITMQYDKENISDYKRVVDYSLYDLEKFSHRYKALIPLIVEESIINIQNSILDKVFTCEELALFYLYRLKEFQDYNIVIELNANIMEEARDLDRKIKEGKVESLFGVMVLIKDNIADKSMHTAAGAYVLKDLRTSRDAHLVKSLKLEDALILGKANLSEWSNFLTMPSSNGYSALGGQTKNAYGQFDVGGSSSGPSAGVSLNLSTISIGTETCGSLIYPASQNSVVTIKPTIGLISRDLIVPITEAQDTAGVIGRTVADVYTVFSNMIKIDENDPVTKVIKDFDLKKELHKPALMRIGVHNSESKIMKKVIKEFEDMGIEVLEIEFDSEEGMDMLPVLEYGMVNDVKNFLKNDSVISSYNNLEEILLYNNNNKASIPFGQVLIENSIKANHNEADINKIIKKNESIGRSLIDNVLEKYEVDVIVSMSNELSHLYATAGYPALSIPAGYRESGEAYGITLLGGHLSDVKLFEMALFYEKKNKHRKLPNH